MAQEFTINSTAIESKINQLLPSQGGFGAGVDFSASTMVIPIVDLTETAEGSDVRADLQTALSHLVTNYAISNSASTVLTTTGYYRFFGNAYTFVASQNIQGTIKISDGSTSKTLFDIRGKEAGDQSNEYYDFIVFLKAGDSIIIESVTTACNVNGSFRQIADISGNLVNP
jgi:hypothetical protein